MIQQTYDTILHMVCTIQLIKSSSNFKSEISSLKQEKIDYIYSNPRMEIDKNI